MPPTCLHDTGWRAHLRLLENPMRDRKDDTAHRRTLEIKLGRKLLSNEVADHLDEDKSNNAPANLDATDRGKHTAKHNSTRGGLSKLRAALRMVKEGRKIY
jgi:hypothetical protein